MNDPNPHAITGPIAGTRTLAAAAARWLQNDDRPTAPMHGDRLPSAALASLARRFAGAATDPGRPMVLLCHGHPDEADLVLAGLASGRPILIGAGTMPGSALRKIRESMAPAGVVAASSLVGRADIDPA